MRRRLLILAAAVAVATSCTPAQRSLAGFIAGTDPPELGTEETTAVVYAAAWCAGVDDWAFGQVPKDHPVWATIEALTGALPVCP